jgi:hypothetical protein
MAQGFTLLSEGATALHQRDWLCISFYYYLVF